MYKSLSLPTPPSLIPHLPAPPPSLAASLWPLFLSLSLPLNFSRNISSQADIFSASLRSHDFRQHFAVRTDVGT